MQPVYLVVGVSGSGKSWVCRQLGDKFTYVPHDRCWEHPLAKPSEGLDPKWGPPGSKSTHVKMILQAAEKAETPVITEVPFAERKLREDLEAKGAKVIPIFVIEEPNVVSDRYHKREGKPLQKAAITRATSILERAREWNAFSGTSDEVLKHLKDLKLSSRMTTEEWRKFNRA